jgi:hypothetical protein
MATLEQLNYGATRRAFTAARCLAGKPFLKTTIFETAKNNESRIGFKISRSNRLQILKVRFGNRAENREVESASNFRNNDFEFCQKIEKADRLQILKPDPPRFLSQSNPNRLQNFRLKPAENIKVAFVHLLRISWLNRLQNFRLCDADNLGIVGRFLFACR